MNVKSMVSTVKNFGDQNSSAILTGLTVAGVAATMITALKKGPKIERILEEKKAAGASNKEIVKAVAPEIAPVIVSAVATGACAIGANTVSSKKIKVLSAAYNTAQLAASEIFERAKEEIGDKKTEKIHDAVCKKKIETNPMTSETNIIVTGNGECTCYDVFSGRYFKSSPDKIQQIINELNQRMLNRDMYIELNEYYDEMNLAHIKMGRNFGWSTENGLIEPWFSSQLDENNNPILIVDFNCGPIWLHTRYNE